VEGLHHEVALLEMRSEQLRTHLQSMPARSAESRNVRSVLLAMQLKMRALRQFEYDADKTLGAAALHQVISSELERSHNGVVWVWGKPAMGTILVVEDEVLIRLDLAQQLRSAGFTVLEASTAHEAIMILQATDGVPLVVTDVRMPGEIDGLGLASWIRLERPGTKVIVLSGHIPALRLATLADAALAKPVKPGQLVREVKRLLGLD